MVATNDLAVRLLAHLRADLRQPDLEYAEPPAAIPGGYDTRVFAFHVTAREVWAAPLVLRLVGPQHDPRRALREQATQNAIAALGQLHGRVDRNGLDSLRPAMQWLLAHRPGSPRPPVICHGDFHPQNILMAGGRITGVLDWSNVVVADAAYDVASTRIILSLVPLTLLPIAPTVRPLVHVMRRLMTAHYLRAYRRRRRIDAAATPYYEAVSCMRQLVRVVEARMNNAATPLDRSDFGERVAAHFTAVSGIAAKIPAAPR